MPKKAQNLEGTADIVSELDILWDTLLKRFNRMSRVYGFSKVETPLLEDCRLYENYYRNQPKRLDSLIRVGPEAHPAALRPSLLPSVLRAYCQHKVYEQSPLSKWAYSGQTMRQGTNGRIETRYEFGLEVFGDFNHLTEGQVIGGIWEFLRSLGLKDLVLEINHLGNEGCQDTYQEALKQYLGGKKYELCDACSDALQDRVLDVFRCDNLDCQSLFSEAPTILDFLDEESRNHFTSTLEALDELSVPYQLNNLHAGPEGFSRTNFIIKHKRKGATTVIGEGGYHEGLVRSLCGKPHNCFGFSGDLGLVRKLLEEERVVAERELKNDVFLVPLGELASKKSLRLFRDLTAEKISVYDHFGQSGVKNQLKQAQVYNAPIALIMGQKEAVDEMVILRDVKSGMQEIISYDKIVEEVKKRLGK